MINLSKTYRSFIVSVGLCTVMAAIVAAQDPNEERFQTEMDKVSYIIGTQMAKSLVSQKIEVNMDVLFQGIRDVLTDKPLAFSDTEINTIMTAFTQKMREKLMAEQQAAQEKALGDKAWKLHLKKPEMMTFAADKDYFWILDTNKGTVKIKLMPDVAPMHVTSTIFLTNKGFYDGLTFHRVITDFMAQGGCPLGTGTGGPGYTYDSEIDPNVKHDRPYLLSMANTGQPNSDGSQFFITFKATPWLDGKHTIFGEVTEGQDVVKKLEAAGTPQGTPKEKLIINKATIEEKAK